jgi:hypothetical protein
MKTMKSLFGTLILAATITACGNSETQTEHNMAQQDAGLNQLTEQEISEGWQLLFDGVSMDQWRVYNQPNIPGESWRVEDGLMVFRPQKTGDWTSGLDIITKETFSDFEFMVEWQISEAGNSGIFYHVIEQPNKALYWSGPEMQILDNENHPDANMGMDGNRKAGSLYDLISADPQNAKSYGEWNQVKIVSNGPVIEHWQNGEMIVRYERWTDEWSEMVANSKFAEHPEFGQAKEGHISLQDHGDVVMFRNIKIRRLNTEE